MIRNLSILAALVAILALPFVLRPSKRASGPVDETLVIISPHTATIREEFARGFADWYRARTGRTIAIDWRLIGGTSEITRYLESQYVAAFETQRRREGKAWNSDIQAGFANGRLPATVAAEVREARAEFLASEVGCGIDVFFGGGPYDFIQQAEAGRLVDCGLLQKHPEWFRDDVIPQSYAGEVYWDKQGRWIGTVLSSYGLLSNRDVLARRGIAMPPEQWTDLSDPRLFGELALANPTRSGSVAKAFENIIQQQMQRRWEELGNRPETEAQAVREGWLAGLRLLQLMGANARYFTVSGQKSPVDVAQGAAGVGLCIDFYGHQQEEAVQLREGEGRLAYRAPPGGSVSSVDPVALLRGAKHSAAARLFIEYVLSMDGQKLWNFRPGTPGGPQRSALRRFPVRRDFYAHEEFRPLRSDPDYDPYHQASQLIYRPAWTSTLYREMGFIIQVMCIDTHEELAGAWKQVIAAGCPPRAMAVLGDLSAVDYEQAGTRIKQALNSKDKLEQLTLAKELAGHFREQYARAARLAVGSE